MVKISLSKREYENRLERVREELTKRGLDALYLASGISFFYLVGFSYIATERPATLIIPLDGDTAYMGPVIEVDHISLKTPFIKVVKTYLDYPGKTHPLELFASWLKEMGLGNKNIGIDSPTGAAGLYGYEGPSIAEKMPEAKFVLAKDIIPNMRLFKSKEEIDLIKESAKWGNLVHQLLHEYTKPGLWDVEIAARASLEASAIMKKALGPEYEPTRWGRMPASAGFRGQVGPMSAIPHAISTKKMIEVGDVLGTGAGADIGGYSSELERTMIVGKPTEKQQKYFNIMLKMQDAALEAYKPGAKCSDVDKASLKVAKEFGCTDLLRHHTGHGIGLEGHEPPWIDQGDNTILKPEMVFSCEPGIYIPGFAGFRHSDTIVITEDGAEMITYYPRDLDSLTITKK